MKSRSIFITGTDTNVGKTWFTVQLVQQLRAAGVDAVAFKPVECGEERSDAKALAAACDDLYSIDEINPVWFADPVAPMVAAQNKVIDLDKIYSAHQQLCAKHRIVLVEGAGGWLVPLTREQSMAELAVELCDSVIVVALNRLGVINHTLLTCAAIEASSEIAPEFVYFNQFRTRYGLDRTGYDQAEDASLDSNFSSLQHCLPNWQLYKDGAMDQIVSALS